MKKSKEFTCKELRRAGLKNLKRHYIVLVFFCLLAGFLGVQYEESANVFKAKLGIGDRRTIYNTAQYQKVKQDASQFRSIIETMISGDMEKAEELSKEKLEENRKTTYLLGDIAIGHTRGYLASAFNSFVSGEILLSSYQMIKTIFISGKLSMIIFLVLAAFVLLFFFIFIKSAFRVVLKRYALEGRLYKYLPSSRTLYLLRSKCWTKVAWTLFLTSLFQTLWTFTIIGGIIKNFSYQMVPYIVAENPSISGREAINLSRQMMDGYKWKSFKLTLSFWPYMFLDLVTAGLVSLFFTNPYREVTFAEFYVKVRANAKRENIASSEKLNDRYLFEIAGTADIDLAYKDVIDIVNEPLPELHRNKGFRGWLEDFFGIRVRNDEKEKLYMESLERQTRFRKQRQEIERESYPVRLAPVNMKAKKEKIGNAEYMRHYSPTNLVFMFFTFCLIGYLWEVSLHLIEDGVFVNRGVLHGPWLPIYGAGGMMILLGLNKLRQKPVKEFFAAMALCGTVEYFTSWVLEKQNGGTLWWSYDGYFLNINGRICAEGLLVFGLGAIVVVYAGAPFFDNVFSKLKRRIARPLAILLVTIFVIDLIYSHQHPNTGEGITAMSDLIQNLIMKI